MLPAQTSMQAAQVDQLQAMVRSTNAGGNFEIGIGGAPNACNANMRTGVGLDIPDQPLTGLITYDANDPETKFPRTTQLRPPKVRQNILIVSRDDESL